MKFFVYFFATLWIGCCSNVIWAQSVTSNVKDGDTIEVVGVYQAPVATVISLGPGRARIEMTPVYKVGINQPPPNSKNPREFNDISGHGTVYMSRAGRFSADVGQLICWKGVNTRINACGPIVGTSTAAILEVGDGVRDQLLLVYPIVEDQHTRARLAFAAHPSNTAVLRRCSRQNWKEMVSYLYIDKEGTIRIALPAEQEVDQQYFANHC